MRGKIKHVIAGLGAAVVGAALMTLMTTAQAEELSLNIRGAVNGQPGPNSFANGYCNQVQVGYSSSSTRNCYVYGKIYDVNGSHVGPQTKSATTWGPAKLAFLAETPASFTQTVAPGSHAGDMAFNTLSTYYPSGYCGTLTSNAEKPFVATAAPGDPNPPNPTLYPSPVSWTDMQHTATDWEEVWEMWAQPCANFAAGNTQGSYPGTIQSHFGFAPGTRTSTFLRRDVAKPLNGGALWFNVPTVDTVYEASDIIDNELYPPFGHRPYRPGIQAQLACAATAGTTDPFGANCAAAGPGGTNGYRATVNANLFGSNMIETILGSESAPHIAALNATFGMPLALLGASSDLGNFSGFLTTYIDYDLLIRNAYLAAHRNEIEGGTISTSNSGRNFIYTNAEVPVTTPDNIPMGGGVQFIYQFNSYQN